MGNYLSEPIRDKVINDCSNKYVSVGDASMQGWRSDQEDAHNVIINYDDDLKTMFFGVYDGHGGAEVAQYTAQALPALLRDDPSYKIDLAVALRDTFISYDLHTVQATTIAKFVDMAHLGEGSDVDEEEDGAETNGGSKNEAKLLHKDAAIPLNKLLQRYMKTAIKEAEVIVAKDKEKDASVDKTKDEAKVEETGGSTKEEGIENNSVKEEAKENNSIKEEAKGNNSVKEEAKGNDSVKEEVKENDSVDEVVKDNDCVKEAEGKDNKVKSAVNMGGGDDIHYVYNKGSGGSGVVASGSGSNKVPAGGSSSNGAEEDDDDDESQAESGVSNETDESSDYYDYESGETDDEEDEFDDDPMRLCSFQGSGEPGYDSGCTSVVAVIRNSRLYVANAGDSRCVVSRAGVALAMSEDHKPEDPEERARIEKAGGHITADGRINGGLNLSRAFGDHAFKTNETLTSIEQMISPEPDVRTLDLIDGDDFMILACDGIWNVMTNQEVVTFVKEIMISNPDTKLSDICSQLFDTCIAPNTRGDCTGCDNMTCVIVDLRNLPKDKPPQDNPVGVVLVSKRSPSGVLEGEKHAKRLKTN